MFSISHKLSRYTAASVHLALSVVFFSALVTTVSFIWYPNPFFSASGGWQGLRLVAAVDLVLGPLITLVIFNPKKSSRELRIDIGLVILVQMGALVWGVKAVYEQRPVAVVFLDTSFYTVPASAISSQGIDLDDLDVFGEQRPVYVYARRPESATEQERFKREVEVERIPPHEQVWLYQNLAEHFEQASRSSLDINEIMSSNLEMKSKIEQVLARSQAKIGDMVFLALTSRYRNVILIFDKNGELMGTVSAPYKSGEV